MKTGKENHYGYNASLRPLAGGLRKNMTKAEACLWKYVLKSRKMMGFSFRRQRPVLNYIADFMCKELMLIIEVDGITHTWEDVAEKDKIRQQELEEAGFTVLRFDDEEVLNDINNVTRTIENRIENSSPVSRADTPSLRGKATNQHNGSSELSSAGGGVNRRLTEVERTDKKSD